MNNKVVGFVMFALGAAVGSAVTWRFLKTKYERIAQEEIDSVKEVFSRKSNQLYESAVRDNSTEEHKNEAKPNLQELADRIKTLKYEIESEAKEQRPYVVTPEEFGQADEDYDIVSLNYYADGVLADDFDVPIENVDDIVGLESLNHFGEYVEDAVYVRNDKLKVEYEIILHARNFSDVVSNDPCSEEEE